jgi:hypothetical protein
MEGVRRRRVRAEEEAVEDALDRLGVAPGADELVLLEAGVAEGVEAGQQLGVGHGLAALLAVELGGVAVSIDGIADWG